MKKSVLSLSIAAAVAGLGMVGGAQAMVAAPSGATVGSDLALNGDGVGHIALVPYFTTQAGNSTLINLVNTDTINAKAVKVRFRGAANSDDIFDFQVFLSPGDVYAFAVAQGADGRSVFQTADVSCSKPSKAVLTSTPFVTSRLDPNLDAAGKANGTREGYVEIFTMADIPKAAIGGTEQVHPTQPLGTNLAGPDAVKADGTAGTDGVNDLYYAIKHKAKVAPCAGTAWTALDTTNLADTAAGNVAGLLPPSTGLMVNHLIVNTVDAAAWGRGAISIQAEAAGVPALGNLVYWPQTGDAVGAPAINSFSADPLLRSADVFDKALAGDTTPAVAAAYYDLPDLSTPYTVAAATPMDQAVSLTSAIAASSATNEFLTDPAILGSTDFLFSQPTRRYNVSLDYAAISAVAPIDDGRRFTDLFGDTLATGYYLPGNTVVTGRQVCVKNIDVKAWDREETTLVGTTDVVVSPSTPADPLSFCGEASVLSINNGGVQPTGTKSLKATVAVKDLDVTFVDGWMTLVTPSATAVAGTDGLPVLGSSFYRSNSGAQSFGAAMEHRFAR